MFKYAFRIGRKCKLPILQLENLKGLSNRQIIPRNYCFISTKLTNNNTNFGYKTNRSNSKTPVVILGGILSFFGFKDTEDEDSLVLLIKRGILCIQRKQFGKAEQMLHLALKMAQDLQDEEGITYIYDVLANLAFETKDYDKAHKLFVSVLQRLLAKGESEDSNKVVDISLKLAKIYEEKKELSNAEKGYKFCIETLDKKLESGDEDTLALWGMSMDWYARYLLAINQKSEALGCFKKAYDMCVKVNGFEHEQTIVLLNDLGTVSTLLGDHESALQYLEKARDIGKKLPEMNDLAAIYVNLGQLYLLKEMYKESRLSCQEGFKIAKENEDEQGASEATECLKKIANLLKGSAASQAKSPQLLIS